MIDWSLNESEVAATLWIEFGVRTNRERESDGQWWIVVEVGR